VWEEEGKEDPLWDRISIYPDKAAFPLSLSIYVFLSRVFVLMLAGFRFLQSFDCSPLASTVKFGISFPISVPIHFLIIFYSFSIHFLFIFSPFPSFLFNQVRRLANE